MPTPKLTGRDLFDGVCALIRVSEALPSSGMSKRYVSDAFDTKIKNLVNSRGSNFTVKGRGWGFTLIVNHGEFTIEKMTGQEADINQTITLARIAA